MCLILCYRLPRCLFTGTPQSERGNFPSARGDLSEVSEQQSKRLPTWGASARAILIPPRRTRSLSLGRRTISSSKTTEPGAMPGMKRAASRWATSRMTRARPRASYTMSQGTRTSTPREASGRAVSSSQSALIRGVLLPGPRKQMTTFPCSRDIALGYRQGAPRSTSVRNDA